MSRNRFTIYDAMEKSNYFSSNPANAGSVSPVDQSQLYSGPVQYPKMLYHPEGEERVIVPAEMVLRAGQYVPVGEQRELLHKIVNDQAENDEALASGWHDHPAKAVEARVNLLIAEGNLTDKETAKLLATIPKLAPSVNRIAELEAEIERLKAERAVETAPAPVVSKPVPKPGGLVPDPDDEDESEAA